MRWFSQDRVESATRWTRPRNPKQGGVRDYGVQSTYSLRPYCNRGYLSIQLICKPGLSQIWSSFDSISVLESNQSSTD